MTLKQMCIAVRTDKAWLYNAARILGRKVHRTPRGARWWGLVRILNSEIGVPLRRAGQAADAVLNSGLATNRIRIAATTDGSVALVFDLARFQSTANAALASALAFGSSAGRGRPRRVRQSETPSLEEPLFLRIRDTPAELEEWARTLNAWDSYPRGIQPGLAFLMDAATMRAVPRLALTTNRGDVDVEILRAG